MPEIKFAPLFTPSQPHARAVAADPESELVRALAKGQGGGPGLVLNGGQGVVAALAAAMPSISAHFAAQQAEQKRAAEAQALVGAVDWAKFGPQGAAIRAAAMANPSIAAQILSAQAGQMLQQPEYGFTKTDDGTIVRTDARKGTAEPAYTPPNTGAFRGSSAEVQAVNHLVNTGAITKDQGAELLAGKTITGTNGEIIFATPQGIFGNGPNGTRSIVTGPTAPADETARKAALLGLPPHQAPAAPVAAPNAAPAGPPAPEQRPGMYQLTPGKPAGFNEGQGRAADYADRVLESGRILQGAATAGQSMVDRGAALLPYGVGNFLTSDDYKRMDQARRVFINSTLRRESGAAISPTEYANAEQQYIPQPGEPEDIVQQKQAARQTVLNGLMREAGPAYLPIDRTLPQPLPRPEGLMAPPPPEVQAPAPPPYAGPVAVGPNGARLRLSDDGTQWVPLQ